MWKLEKINDKKYPYSISIEKGEKTKLQILSQSKWPKSEESVFCIRAESKPDIKVLEVIEEIPVVSARWLEDNTKISLILERNNNKNVNLDLLRSHIKIKKENMNKYFSNQKEIIRLPQSGK